MDHKDYYISPDDGYEETRHRSRKKTREWCKGKVGIMHAGRWEPYRRGDTVLKDWKAFVCQNCRKCLKMEYPIRHWGTIL